MEAWAGGGRDDAAAAAATATTRREQEGRAGPTPARHEVGSCKRTGAPWPVEETGREAFGGGCCEPAHEGHPGPGRGLSQPKSFTGTLPLLVGLRRTRARGTRSGTATTRHTSDTQCLSSEKTGGTPDALKKQQTSKARLC